MTSSAARLAAAGPTAPTVTWLAALPSMLQPLATDLHLPMLAGIAACCAASILCLLALASAPTRVRRDGDFSHHG